MAQPDSAGWWAWEGFIDYADGDIAPNSRDVVRVYWGIISKAWYARGESGIRPCKMMIGKWHKLILPWDTREASNGHN